MKIKWMIIITFLLICIPISLVMKLFNDLEKQNNIVKQAVGMKVVLEKDTLMIVDYSLLNSTFTLSNGKEIDMELVNKLKRIK